MPKHYAARSPSIKGEANFPEIETPLITKQFDRAGSKSPMINLFNTPRRVENEMERNTIFPRTREMDQFLISPAGYASMEKEIDGHRKKIS